MYMWIVYTILIHRVQLQISSFGVSVWLALENFSVFFSLLRVIYKKSVKLYAPQLLSTMSVGQMSMATRLNWLVGKIPSLDSEDRSILLTKRWISVTYSLE